MKLPFLKNTRWPRIAKISGESRYGYSEDDELCESALDELMAALDAKDSSQLMSALKALIECIRNKNETDSHEDAGIA